MICDTFPPAAAGPGYHVYGLSKRLVERKHQVTVITRGSWKKAYYKEIIDGITVYRVRFIPTFPFHLQPHGFFVSEFLKSLESNFDVVHLHNANIPVVDTSLPKVVTVHGTMKGYIAHRKRLDFQSLVVRTFSSMYIKIDREVINSADRVIAVSKACADELKVFYGVKNLETIPNAVDTSFFYPSNGKNDLNPCVLYTGRLSPEKGIIDLIKAAEYVRKDYPDIKFVIAGKGPLERRLKNIVSKLDLEKNFHFAGYVNHDALLKYYQSATLYVLPSYREGLPTGLLEAMSCGLPVVATAIAGTSEVVVERKTGLLVPPNAPERLANAILTLIVDSKLREEMGSNARKRIGKFYDWNSITTKIERVYQSLYAHGS